jgi:hypothetical protein
VEKVCLKTVFVYVGALCVAPSVSAVPAVRRLSAVHSLSSLLLAALFWNTRAVAVQMTILIK